MNNQPFKKSPEFIAIYHALKKQLDELPHELIPGLKQGGKERILEQLTLDLLKMKGQKQDIKDLLTPTNTKFLLFAYSQPEFKDLIKNDQLLKLLTSPQNELSLKLFAQFRLALDKCFKNKKLTPEQQKLYEKLKDTLSQLEKARESKKDITPLSKSPTFKKAVDPLLEFFQLYFGQDIRQPGASVSTLRGPISSGVNVDPSLLNQGPGDSAAEDAVLGNTQNAVTTQHEKDLAEGVTGNAIDTPAEAEEAHKSKMTPLKTKYTPGGGTG